MRPAPRRALGFTLAALLALAACGGDGTSSSDDDADTGTATAAATTIAADGAPTGLTQDPDAPTELVVLSSAQPTQYAADAGSTGGYDGLELMMNIHAGLVRNPWIDGPSGRVQDWYNFEPYLAESWDVSPDGLTYTFHLHQGLLSQAGNELTTDDVLWTYERKWAATAGSTRFINAPQLADPATQFAKIDDHTFTLTMAKPGYWFTMLSLLANSTGYIYDADMLKEHVTAADPYAIEWSKTTPNWGFGAYSVDRLTPGAEMVLKANPNFVLGEPAIKEVTYKVVADSASRANALRSGDADMTTQLRPADQADLRDDEGIYVPTSGDGRTGNLFLRIDLVHNKAPFDDATVRDALAYAIPYQQIIDNVYLGNAAPIGAMLAESAPGFDGTGLEPWTYDPDKAKELLAEAGHPDGLGFTLTVSAAQPDQSEAAVQIQSFAKDAGFDVTIEQLPAPAYQTGLNEGAFQAFLERDYSIVMAPSYELLVWASAGAPTNRAKWESQEYYDAVAEGVAIPDALSPEAGKAWNAAEQILRRDKPWILISYVQPFFAMTACVQGFEFRSDNAINLFALTRGC